VEWTTRPQGVACRGHWPLGTSSAQFTVYRQVKVRLIRLHCVKAYVRNCSSLRPYDCIWTVDVGAARV